MNKDLQEVKNILNLPPEKRLEKILSSNDPKGIVESFSEEELWLTIKKGGEEESLSLIALASAEQIQYILDIELWKKDRFITDRSLYWLALLKECGDKKALQWVFETDADTVILIFKEFIHVIKKETSDDDPLEKVWPGSLPPQTMDGLYYYQALTKDADEVVKPIFELVAKTDYDFFMKLCEEIMAELRSNLEETSFSWRSKRLAEKGFAPIEESLGLYKYLSEREMLKLPKRGEYKFNRDVDKEPFNPLALCGESYPILMLALSGVKNTELEGGVKLEIASLANKVLMADGRPISPETIDASLKKVMGYVNIGLEKLSGANPKKGEGILKEHYVINLFQVGHSLVTKLRQNARKFMKNGWPALVENDLSLLEDVIAGRLQGILLKLPRYASFENIENPYREFRNIDEVREVERNIEYAEYVGRLFSGVFNISPVDVLNLVTDFEVFKWSNVLLTIWAKGVATGNYKFAPVSEKELKQVLKKSWEPEKIESSIRSFSLDVSSSFYHWLIERQPNISQNEEKYCRKFVEESFSTFLEEFSEMFDLDQIDWRYIQSLWIIPEAD